jgi:DUF971 family protein
VRAAPGAIRLLRAENRLEIVWATGGPASRYRIWTLRTACPCASCIDEFTGEPLLDPATVPADVGIVQLRAVGNYAIAAEFSDGHSTGLFTWDRLYALEPEPGPA